MSIETDLIDHLLSQTVLTDVIGTRLYALEVAQGATAPAVIYEIANRPRDQAQGGETGLTHMTIRFECFGITYTQVRATERALRTIFYRFHNREMGDSYIQWAQLSDAKDKDVPPVFADESGVYHGIFTLSIWYEEAAAAAC